MEDTDVFGFLESVIVRDTASDVSLLTQHTRGELELACRALHACHGPVRIAVGSTAPDTARGTDRASATAILLAVIGQCGREVILDPPSALDAYRPLRPSDDWPGDPHTNSNGSGEESVLNVFVSRSAIPSAAADLTAIGSHTPSIALVSALSDCGAGVALEPLKQRDDGSGRSVVLVSPVSTWAAWALAAGLYVLSSRSVPSIEAVLSARLVPRLTDPLMTAVHTAVLESIRFAAGLPAAS